MACSIITKASKPSRFFSNIWLPFRENKTLLFIALLSVTLLSSCNYDDVDVKDIREVKIHKLDAKGIEFSAFMHVENPNNYKIKVVSTDADIYLSGRKAGKGNLMEKLVIPANFNDVMEAKVRADFDEGSMGLLPLIIGAAMSKKIDIRIKGDMRAKSFLIGRKFDFDYTHEATF